MKSGYSVVQGNTNIAPFLNSVCCLPRQRFKTSRVKYCKNPTNALQQAICMYLHDIKIEYFIKITTIKQYKYKQKLKTNKEWLLKF